MKKETPNFRNVTENPCHMCMPMGGIIPFKGIEQSMVILHGSQGCATYMRRHIAEHFNEPIDVGSSSLNEKGTVYGGEQNLKTGLDNIMKVYRPKLVGVLTTCLAETIGEDIERITSDYLRDRGLEGFPVVTVPTPGYGDSHFEGYWFTLTRIVTKLTQRAKRHSRVNVIVPNISPADIREIKRLLELMGVEYILFPDFSETLDRPFEKPYQKIPAGGTRTADIKVMAGSAATIQFGMTVEDSMSPGRFLQTEYDVPLYNLPIPMGVENTDLFFACLKEITGKEMPASLRLERGRLLDAMVDSHKYNFHGRSVIFGEPELVFAVTKTCSENGIFPVVVATGSRNSKLPRLLKGFLHELEIETRILTSSDFTQIRKNSREMGANIAIGSSEGRYLTEKEGIPLVRLGFPIHDRVGGQRLLSVGYTGTTMFLDRITNTLLENKLTNYRSSMYQKYYKNYHAAVPTH
ncbi:nitrogenase [Thermincola ferriacetica]|uniref:Nitrogenase n=1 Tax=Thermincola ferriacetica TaxID=281456 RepID=A0A0L6W2T8_9FIRM|nr:nitrogenase component 1 [Thermincola ferriacetica]KNZ69855.1 nitrogenase [Thermincola ferriacetica]